MLRGSRNFLKGMSVRAITQARSTPRIVDMRTDSTLTRIVFFSASIKARLLSILLKLTRVQMVSLPGRPI